MNNPLDRRFVIGGMLPVDNLYGTAFTGEEDAHTFRITAYDGSVPAAITGQIAGKFVNPAGVTVPLSGSLDEDGRALVTLDEHCYVVEGQFILTIWADTQVIYCGVGQVMNSQTDTIDYPTSGIPDVAALIQQLQTILNNWPADYSQLQSDVSNLKSAVGKPQTSFLEQGNINSSTGVPSNSTAYIRTSEYLDINTVTVTKPSGVGMTIYYYANPTDATNGFISPAASWSRNAARSGDLHNSTDYPTATHVKIRWDISGTNPITVETLLATGLTVDYYISSLGLKKLIDNAQQDVDTLETAFTTLDGVVYKQSVMSNNATSLMSLTNIGVYRCKASVAANITDAPSTGAFVVAVLESLGGGYMQQIYINANQEIYARIINATDSTVYKDWERLNPPKYNPSVLTGKKWVACGDSFTHGDFSGIDDVTQYQFQDSPYKNENKVYPFFIGRRTGCTVINEAVNGSHMGYVEGRGNKNFSAPNGRYTQIPADADYITLYFGINDGPNHQNVPIGTIDDNTNTTFYGAWNVVMDYLTANHPNAKIGIIISNGCDSIDYPNAEIAIAKKWGVSYLDMNGDYKIPLVFRVNGKPDLSATIKSRRNEQYMVSETNGHPNAACHEDESTFIQAWLESI